MIAERSRELESIDSDWGTDLICHPFGTHGLNNLKLRK